MHNPSRQGGSRLFLATCALVAPLFLATLPARAQEPAETQPPAASERLVSVDVREARLETTITGLMSLNGLTNIVVRNEAGKHFGLVTVKLADQPLRKVLQAIASSAGAVLEDQDGIYYLRHKSDKDDAPKPQEPRVAPKPNPAEAVPVPAAKPRKPRQMARLPLNYMQPSIFVKMLEDPAYLPVLEAQTPAFESPLKIGSSPMVIQNGFGNNNPAPNNNNSAPGNNAPSTTPPVSGAAGGSAGREGEDAGRQGVGGRFGGGAGAPGGFGGQGGPGNLGGGGGGFGQGGQQGQNSLRPQGITNIIASDTQNALIVEYDDVEDLNRLREIIRLLDVAPQQVLIRAEFVAVNVSDADAFGVDWRFTPASNLDVAIPPESGTQPTVTIAYASGNAVANLRASIIRSTRNILQAPIISTLNNLPASITFTDVQSIPVTTNIVGANGQIISGTSQIPISANNGLNVTPHINGDGTITLSLQPQLATNSVTAAGGINSQFQTLTTTRRIRNGETMVLGGFITKAETRELRKVPLLSDLPILGNLFTQRSRQVVGSEVLVFVTATIIDESGNSVVGASQPTGPLP